MVISCTQITNFTNVQRLNLMLLKDSVIKPMQKKLQAEKYLRSTLFTLCTETCRVTGKSNMNWEFVFSNHLRWSYTKQNIFFI